jgi:hypothetical protein
LFVLNLIGFFIFTGCQASWLNPGLDLNYRAIREGKIKKAGTFQHRLTQTTTTINKTTVKKGVRLIARTINPGIIQ